MGSRDSRDRAAPDAGFTLQNKGFPSGFLGAPFTTANRGPVEVRYSLNGPDIEFFAIDANSGQLKTSASLEFQDRTDYSLTVVATDTDDAAYFDKVRVTVVPSSSTDEIEYLQVPGESESDSPGVTVVETPSVYLTAGSDPKPQARVTITATIDNALDSTPTYQWQRRFTAGWRDVGGS